MLPQRRKPVTSAAMQPTRITAMSKTCWQGMLAQVPETDE